jgi:hypothetical protein
MSGLVNNDSIIPAWNPHRNSDTITSQRTKYSSFILNQTPEPPRELCITLTVVGNAQRMTIQVKPKEMLAYSQQTGFTKLRLTGNKVLEVEEGTDHIDRLIRCAASNRAGNEPGRG